MGAAAAAFLTVSGPCLSIHELPGLAARVCGCSAVPLARGGLGCHTHRHVYALPKVGTIKTQHRSSFSPAVLFHTVTPQILWIFSQVLFILRSCGFLTHCSTWCCLLLLWKPLSVHCTARVTAGFPVIIVLPTVSGRCIRQGGRDS